MGAKEKNHSVFLVNEKINRQKENWPSVWINYWIFNCELLIINKYVLMLHSCIHMENAHIVNTNDWIF